MSPDTIKSRALACVAAAVIAGGAAMPAARAAGVPLDAAPPDTLSNVAPNVMLTFDDSGSMVRAYMPDDIGVQNRFNDNATGAGSRHVAAYYASESNTIYYNPSITYMPPLKPDGVTRFPDSSYTAAWRDGICANLAGACTAIVVNLSTNFYQGFDSFKTTVGDTSGVANSLARRDIPASVRTAGSTVITGGFYYVRSGSGPLTLVSVNDLDDASKKNFANWYSYYRTRNLMVRSSLSTAFSPLGEGIRVVWQNLTLNPLGASSPVDTFAGTHRDAFFKWLYTEPATGGATPNRSAMARVIDYFSNQRGTGTKGRFNPYWQSMPGQPGGGMELSCRQSFHLLITDGYWNGDTPNDTTIKVSSAFTLPDGRAYSTSSKETLAYRNEKRTSDSNAKPSLADLGFQAWAKDLREDIDDKVPRFLGDASIGVTNPASRPIPAQPFDDDEIYFNPANDPATWQHVVNFMVGLGMAGTLKGSTPDEVAATTRSLRTGDTAWPVPNTGSSSDLVDDVRKLDDTWHAAVNSRGSFLSARDPQELVDGIDNILRSAVSNREGGATVAGVSSAFVGAGGQVYATSYSSSGWYGDLVAKKTDADGAPTGAAVWSAGAKLTARSPNDRRIFTTGPTGRTGKGFTYDNLGVAQKLVLNKTPANVTGNRTRRENPANWTLDFLGKQRVAYLRGDRSAERDAPNFRPRTTLLGAIIDSQPVYVSSPGGRNDNFPFGSPEQLAFAKGDSYEKFVSDYRSREPTVYVGSNDGMLHAFDATSGEERWAYFPGTLLSNGRATRMTMPGGELVPGADDTLITSDVFIKGQWRTVLVGSLRLGGRGVYAIDITSPAAASESDAAGKLLWEFNNESAGGARLGYTYGSTNIVRLNTGKWAVVVSGGYFPTDGLDSKDDEATSGRTSLLVLDLETGAVIKELRSPDGVTSYGLSRAGALDASQNWTTEILMAGDLAGNLFRYDVSSSDPERWTVRHFFKTYTAADDIGKQPISVMPLPMSDRVTNLPVWIFGTGKFIGEPDRMAADQPTQTYYGVRDPAFGAAPASATYPITPATLQAQTLTTKGRFRSATAIAVPPSMGGWRIDMPEAGERNTLIATGLPASGLVVLESLLPLSNGDPCEASRSGFLMVLDVGTGGVPVGPDGTPRVVVKDCPEGTSCVGKPTPEPPPISGAVSVGSQDGGGTLRIPGEPDVTIRANYWHRQAWRELFNLYDSNP